MKKEQVTDQNLYKDDHLLMQNAWVIPKKKSFHKALIPKLHHGQIRS